MNIFSFINVPLKIQFPNSDKIFQMLAICLLIINFITVPLRPGRKEHLFQYNK